MNRQDGEDLGRTLGTGARMGVPGAYNPALAW